MLYVRFPEITLPSDGSLGVWYPTYATLVNNSTDEPVKVQLPLGPPFGGATIELPATTAVVQLPDGAYPPDLPKAEGNDWLAAGEGEVLVGCSPATSDSWQSWLGSMYLPVEPPYETRPA